METTSPISFRKSVLGLLATMAICFFAYNSRNTSHADGNHFVDIKDLPETIGNWSATTGETFTKETLNTLKLDDYWVRNYKDDKGRQVRVYIGYWKKQSGDYQAAKHSPSVCLPANGWTTHFQKEAETKGNYNVAQVLADQAGTREFYNFWFFSGNRTYTKEWLALLLLGIESATTGRTDGGLVEVSAKVKGSSKTDVVEAENTVKEFMDQFSVEFEKWVTKPRT